MRHNHTSLNGAVFAALFLRPLILSDQSYTSALRKDVHPLASCIPPPFLPPSTLSYLSLVSQCPIRATQVLCLPQINRKLMHFSASTQITVALSRLCLTRGVCVCVLSAVASVQPTTSTKHTDTLGHRVHGRLGYRCSMKVRSAALSLSQSEGQVMFYSCLIDGKENTQTKHCSCLKDQ